MQLWLINPFNPLVSLVRTAESRWNRYRVWKPLGLLAVAALTPEDWQVTVIDENLGVPDYTTGTPPDLVGITAFTSQASRAYELAETFRQRGVPVVMGGIHASMCPDEALEHVDTVVKGEAEGAWPQVLADARQGQLRRIYKCQHADMATIPPARHELLSKGYAFGAIQTTRGCPLHCEFCSVSAFNGNRYRRRPTEKVLAELRQIREKWVLIVDDNLIGITPGHLAQAKELLRAMIKADLGKKWIAQVTINMADDEELLSLATAAGCQGVFIGFESPTAQGLAEVGKQFNLLRNRDFRASVRRIQRHHILVMGSFIMGLDTDEPGIGGQIVAAARHYGVDLINVLFLTPLPGTRLWERLRSQDRIAANNFPADWRYYTLGFPTARYRGFSWAQLVDEMNVCDRRFYSRWGILRRVVRHLLQRRHPVLALVGNLSYRNNARMTRRSYGELDLRRGEN
jgi:radical SAM superfamily enzyme YgiQ (UPF0313 family)